MPGHQTVHTIVLNASTSAAVIRLRNICLHRQHRNYTITISEHDDLCDDSRIALSQPQYRCWYHTLNVGNEGHPHFVLRRLRWRVCVSLPLWIMVPIWHMLMKLTLIYRKKIRACKDVLVHFCHALNISVLLWLHCQLTTDSFIVFTHTHQDCFTWMNRQIASSAKDNCQYRALVSYLFWQCGHQVWFSHDISGMHIS